MTTVSPSFRVAAAISGEGPKMEYGFSVPTRGPMATPANMALLAKRGEGMGFEIINVSDHIVIPRAIASTYPYSPTGEFAGTGECLEQLTTLSFLAGQTSSVRLLSSVMVLPHRSPVLTAKILATIDVLSGGRLTVGCGVGWMKEELEAIGAPPYEERGRVGDEYIRAFKELWTSASPSFKGDYCEFDDILFEPKPVQKPHPPIWIGGESPPALRRAARLGDAWYPIGSNPRFPVSNAKEYADSVARVRRYAEEAGRDPYEIGLAYNPGWYNDREAERGPDGQRRTFTGTPQQVADDIKTFEELGVRSLIVRMQGSTVDDMHESMQWFTDKVRPLAEA